MDTVFGVEQLKLKFPSTESRVLNNLTIKFKPGEKVLILGPSGSGKSTLLQVLTGIIPNSIEVPMKAKSLTIPKSWGFLFQDPDTQFCMPNVDEEIAFVLENLQIPREEMNDYINDYLSQVGLDFSNNHILINTLSGGMKQRLAIASVLALKPDVLFLDEPTALLDTEGTKEVWDVIKSTCKEKTLVIVEHKIDHIIDFVDRVILMDSKGNIIIDDTKDNIFKNHKDKIIELGIWYPGVWDDYQITKKNKILYKKSEPILSLSNFNGYRGKIKRIEIDKINLYPGEWVAITGKNGAGKSTLLHSLMKFIKTKGSYNIEGKSYKNITRISDYLSFVFQNPEFQFVTNTVYDEVAYSLRLRETDEEMILKRVNELLDFIKLDKHSNNHPYQLSIGQKRRLSVATAIVNNQPILLLDEPTFGQDAKNTFIILEQLEKLRNKGIAIVMVIHDLDIVKKFATREWVIDNGLLVEDRLIGEYICN